jgi:hypothetical protein
MPWWQQPFFQVALPIVVTFAIATWYQSSRISDLRDTLSKRIDDLRSDMNARFAEVNTRFQAVERRLEKLEERIEALQELALARFPISTSFPLA